LKYKYRNFKRPFLLTKKYRWASELPSVKYVSLLSRIGDFLGHSSTRGAKFLGVLASSASQGGCRLRELNRMGGENGLGSGRVD
jgi:hypothetical protein